MTARKFNPSNERIKHRYLAFLGNAKQMSPASVDQSAATLADYEGATSLKDFQSFRIEHAQRYKRYLSDAQNTQTGKPLAKATISSRLKCMKAFFQWLSHQPGFRSKITYSDAEYFNPTANDERIAKATREKQVPSLEQIRATIFNMPTETDIQRRNQALMAFAILSGARDNAIASMSLKHVDVKRRRVTQDAREVQTKNRKTMFTTFFPVGDDIEAVFAKWIEYLNGPLLWGPDDPLFPATKVALGESGLFESDGLDRKHWKNAAAIRKIFKEAFEDAGLPYFNPHSFRSTLATAGEDTCPNVEAFKAWSQNLGHSQVLTTLTSYGSVSQPRQDEILTKMKDEPSPIVFIQGGMGETSNIHEVLARMEKKLERLSKGNS